MGLVFEINQVAIASEITTLIECFGDELVLKV